MHSLRGLIVLTALLSSQIAYAEVREERLDVLGIKLKEPRAASVLKLKGQGFVRDASTFYKHECLFTMNALVQKAVADRVTKIDDNRAGCKERYIKGSSIVTLDFYMTPQGFATQGVSYRFDSTESPESIYGRLVQKFGPSDSRYEKWGTNYFSANPQDRLMQPHATFYGSQESNLRDIAIRAGIRWSEDMRKQVEQELKRSLPGERAVL